MANPNIASMPLPDDDDGQAPDDEQAPTEDDGTAEVPAGGAGADSGARMMRPPSRTVRP